MTNSRIFLIGSAMAALLCGAGVANAQSTYDRSYDDPAYQAAPAGPASETVIVHPNDIIEQRQLMGHINGEVNPQAYTISRNIDLSDLNLANRQDRDALHERVFQTASDLCAELDARVPGLSGDRSADSECVRDVMDRYYYG